MSSSLSCGDFAVWRCNPLDWARRTALERSMYSKAGLPSASAKKAYIVSVWTHICDGPEGTMTSSA
jgi:hypothetical protein